MCRVCMKNLYWMKGKIVIFLTQIQSYTTKFHPVAPSVVIFLIRLGKGGEISGCEPVTIRGANIYNWSESFRNSDVSWILKVYFTAGKVMSASVLLLLVDC